MKIHFYKSKTHFENQFSKALTEGTIQGGYLFYKKELIGAIFIEDSLSLQAFFLKSQDSMDLVCFPIEMLKTFVSLGPDPAQETREFWFKRFLFGIDLH